MHEFPDSGLYVITRDSVGQRSSLIDEVASAIRGGAVVVQYRAKQPRNRLAEAAALLALCREASVPLIINDDIQLAAAIGADGVHLGRHDASVEFARQRLGSGAILGVSCYDDLELAITGVDKGADYVAFGRFFPSLTKPDAPCARIQTLSGAKARLNVPIVAIGGITSANGGSLLAAGADFLAVIEGVFGADKPECAAREFRALWADKLKSRV